VSREVQAAVLLVMGIVIARLVLTDAYLGYVKSTLFLPLLASAGVLVALGVLSLVRDHEDELAPVESGRESEAATEVDHTDRDDQVDLGLDLDLRHGHGHDHATAPRIGMLMLVPILALLLIAPQPLGSYAASRGGANRVAEPVVALGPLPAPIDGAVQLSLADTVVRAIYEPDGPMSGTPVRLIGFVAGDQDAPGYRLSRFSLSCCAADASVRQVLVTGSGQEFPEDTWVEVVARFDGEVFDPDGEGGASSVPVLRVIEQRLIEPPISPYEY
jgi:uncharacterized repeat protein (TIGR03943 family)